MKATELAIARLLPGQPTVYARQVDYYRGDLIVGEPFAPVRALPYPHDTSETCILLDGHHRAKAAYLEGLDSILGHLFETDQEINDFASSREWGNQSPSYTRDDVRKEWYDGWRIMARNAGSLSIASLVVI